MEGIRKHHNTIKRELIAFACTPECHVLDVGCGFGGDLPKYKSAGVTNLNMCDPDESALVEARQRAKNLDMRRVNFYHGDIHAAPKRVFDVIVYNFSLHYCFASRELFESTIREIRKRVKRGGRLVGVIPDSRRILSMTPYKDEEGNFFKMKLTHGNGDFGEKLFVQLAGVPFYDDGPKSEPVCYSDVLITSLENAGFRLHMWEPLQGARISQMYSKFLFVFNK
ncbi:hypothetical protein DSLPV1_077 [Dishui lake phycodnavirus 1]|uniref:hypothetical protein n=1 Tax=Dishui lake phycodnavirus 1 TaxID=2079134 RepID=UPI000CD6B798|nr:hypothetical protein C5Y57_gp077 [Dishui lake phycodnavirus 1]AUT19048.1 hypothetical protein DSLPV1_077 [Dishui lake phycodnavirus 1]